MAIARVQSVVINVNGTTNQWTAAFTGVTAGNALIASFAVNDTQPPTSVGDGTNTWHFATSASTNPPWIDATGTGLNYVIMTAYALSVAGGSVTVKGTLPATAATFANGAVGEYSGVGSFGTGVTTNPNNTNNPATFPALTVASGGLVVETIAGEFAQTGLTPISPMVADPADSAGFTFYTLITSGPTYTPSWNNTSPRTYAGVAAYFAPSGAVASPPASLLAARPPAALVRASVY